MSRNDILNPTTCFGLVSNRILVCGAIVYELFSTASVSAGLLQIAMNMLVLGKRSQISCSSILADLAGRAPRPEPIRAAGVPIPNIGDEHCTLECISNVDVIAEPKTPWSASFSTSPETDYFRSPPSLRRSSRWKEDWEELELLVGLIYLTSLTIT
jgi:eukaryotic translation initiation factor 2-alpha kinase 4